MKKLILLSCLLLSACATTPYQLPKPSLQHAQHAFATRHFKDALQELTILAIDGNYKAQYALGYMYFYGQGTPRDLDLARGWFKKSANQGYGKARKALQMMSGQALTTAN